MSQSHTSQRHGWEQAARWLAHGARVVGAITLSTAAASCASSGAVPRPFPPPGGATTSPGRPQTLVDGDSLVGTALQLRGVPYRNRGADPSGFDCSGFTQYVFARHGIVLPREVRDQFRLGRKVKPRSLAPGDLLFFSTILPGASHVAILVGGDQFVHAPSSAGVVRVERLSAPYWSRRFLGARRIDAPP